MDWPWSPPFEGRGYLEWKCAGGWVQTHHRGPAKPQQAPAQLGSPQAGSCLALAAWKQWWRSRIKPFRFSGESISSTAFKQPPQAIPLRTVLLLKDKLHLIPKNVICDNVRPVFILRRKKLDPQYKKFHFIQVKSKACIPLALMNTEASCTDFFSPSLKYYCFLYSWTHKSDNTEGDQRWVI